MIKKYQKLMEQIGESKISLNKPLDKYSTFKIGGKADLFVRAKNSEDLVSIIKSAGEYGIPFFILGGGTNLLISDNGFKGLVIKNESGKIKLAGIRGGNSNINRPPGTGMVQTVYLEVDSGVPVNRLVRYTLDQGLRGMEIFLGQPGTVGGAVYINAHNMKKNRFFGDNIISAKIISGQGEIKEVGMEYFKFGYDNSILQKSKEILISVLLKLDFDNRDRLWKEAQNVLTYRQKTQPYGVNTSGCTFRNISKSDAMRLATPDYTCSAGYLLDKAGLKGLVIGGAKFSDQHANFIINSNHAKASDVIKLIKLAKAKVKSKFGVDLFEEIVLVGDFTYG